VSRRRGGLEDGLFHLMVAGKDSREGLLKNASKDLQFMQPQPQVLRVQSRGALGWRGTAFETKELRMVRYSGRNDG
jgi:hypothetical protein